MSAPVVSSPAPRWGRQTSIFQPRQPAFWLFCLLLAFGTLFFGIEQLFMAGLPAAWLLSWGLVLVYAIPVALLIYRLDLFEREPKTMLAGALLWGGIVATGLAVVANEAWLSVVGKVTSPEFATQWGPAIVGPGVEETLKLMGVVVLFLIASSEFDGVMDGFVYGAMIGLGFTVVEDVSYFIIAAAAVPGAVDQSGPVISTFLLRIGAGGLYSHVLFTGLTGMGFAYLVTQRSVGMGKRLGGSALLVAAGVAAHAVWNSPVVDFVLDTRDGADPSGLQWIAWASIKGLPFLLLLGVMVVLATRSEERSYRAIVAGEPDPMVVTDDEMRSLGSLWARRSARRAAARAHGSEAGRLVGKLQAAQIEYAMIRSKSDSPADSALDSQRLKVRWIRSALAGTPFVPSAGLGPVAGLGPIAGPGSIAGPGPQASAAAPASVAVPARPQMSLVPTGGIAAWSTPDASRLPVIVLPERLELAVEARTGSWAEVRSANGWRGWVDGRLLVEGR
ncbi:MAG TPA: PrsW family intramembrane metalloprotease [Candidatus Limnocylindrales bacterium]